MKERPILFNGPMVRALLNGSKTQTRRAVKLPHQNPLGSWESFDWGGPNGGRTAQGETVPFQQVISHTRTGEIISCPHGQPGDRLWVRETWRSVPMICLNDGKMSNRVEYAAGNRVLPYGKPPAIWDIPKHGGLKWSPSIHMLRKDSRITLEVVSVRVERLQDISRGDAMKEGCPFPNMAQGDNPRHWYAELWESINGQDSWDANPWIWAIEFKRITP